MARPSERRPESVLVLVYTSDADVLLLQRSDNPDFWQSVTGALDKDEQPVEAAHRELLEETGLKLPLVDHQQTRQYPIAQQWRARYPAWAKINTEHLFSACVQSSVEVTLDPAEHLDARWVTASEAIDQVFSATNREAISQIVLNNHGE
jgi:dATP pyrophosphohydrolase